MAVAPDPNILRENLLQYISPSSLPSYTSYSPHHRLLVQVADDEIFSANTIGNRESDSSEMENRKRKRDMLETVQWLRGVALNPVDPDYVIRNYELEVLSMRREMYLDVDGVVNIEDLPNFPSLRRKKKAHLSDERNKGKRRSERIAKNFKLPEAHLVTLRRRIGVGEIFQSDMLDWLGPPSVEDLSSYRNSPANSKYLGTHLWPQRPVIELNEQNQNVLPCLSDKPMPNYCECIRPGDVACIRHHVHVARSQLNSELGQAFQALGFESMGEQVSQIFAHEHRMLFDALERGITPLSGPKDFWSIASRHLSTKERRHLVSYFFNVYLLRRVGNQSRSGPASLIDSDEDVCDGDDEEQVCNDGQVQASTHVSSDRLPSRKRRG